MPSSVTVTHELDEPKHDTIVIAVTPCGTIVDRRTFKVGFRRTDSLLNGGRSTIWVDHASITSARAAAADRWYQRGTPIITNTVATFERHDFSIQATDGCQIISASVTVYAHAEGTMDGSISTGAGSATGKADVSIFGEALRSIAVDVQPKPAPDETSTSTTGEVTTEHTTTSEHSSGSTIQGSTGGEKGPGGGAAAKDEDTDKEEQKDVSKTTTGVVQKKKIQNTGVDALARVDRHHEWQLVPPNPADRTPPVLATALSMTASESEWHYSPGSASVTAKITCVVDRISGSISCLCKNGVRETFTFDKFFDENTKAVVLKVPPPVGGIAAPGSGTSTDGVAHPGSGTPTDGVAHPGSGTSTDGVPPTGGRAPAVPPARGAPADGAPVGSPSHTSRSMRGLGGEVLAAAARIPTNPYVAGGVDLRATILARSQVLALAAGNTRQTNAAIAMSTQAIDTEEPTLLAAAASERRDRLIEHAQDMFDVAAHLDAGGDVVESDLASLRATAHALLEREGAETKRRGSTSG